jgi:hypothetical protein
MMIMMMMICALAPGELCERVSSPIIRNALLWFVASSRRHHHIISSEERGQLKCMQSYVNLCNRGGARHYIRTNMESTPPKKNT